MCRSSYAWGFVILKSRFRQRWQSFYLRLNRTDQALHNLLPLCGIISVYCVDLPDCFFFFHILFVNLVVWFSRWFLSPQCLHRLKKMERDLYDYIHAIRYIERKKATVRKEMLWLATCLYVFVFHLHNECQDDFEKNDLGTINHPFLLRLDSSFRAQ